MDEPWRLAWEWVRSHWTRWYAPLAFVPLLYLAVVVFTSSLDFSKLTRVHHGIAIAVVLLLLAKWGYSVFTPRVKRGRVGLIVAIVADDEAHAEGLRRNLVERLEALLSQGTQARSFHVLTYPQFIAKRIKSHDDATKLMERSGGTVLLFGRARVGKDAGQDVQALSLEGVASAGVLVPKGVQARIQEECNGILPGEIKINMANDLPEFRLSSELIDMVARYVVALMALAAKDLQLGEQLLTAALARARGRRDPIARRITARAPHYLAIVYEMQLGLLTEAYVVKRDEQLLEEQVVVARKLEHYVPGHYAAQLAFAMAAFKLDDDLDAAYAALGKCERVHDSAWKYSRAFLLAYEGKLGQARRLYTEAFRTPGDDNTPTQCEEFMDLVLEDHPEKYQLYYCQGLINAFAKEDPESAVRDMRAFLARVEGERFGDAQREAQRIIEGGGLPPA